jgi:hypothetical protein
MYPSPYERCIELPDGMIICVVKKSKKQVAQAKADSVAESQEAHRAPVTPTLLLQRLNPFRLLRHLWHGLRRKSLAKS